MVKSAWGLGERLTRLPAAKNVVLYYIRMIYRYQFSNIVNSPRVEEETRRRKKEEEEEKKTHSSFFEIEIQNITRAGYNADYKKTLDVLYVYHSLSCR